jgi:hypothetical protein
LADIATGVEAEAEEKTAGVAGVIGGSAVNNKKLATAVLPSPARIVSRLAAASCRMRLPARDSSRQLNY